MAHENSGEYGHMQGKAYFMGIESVVGLECFERSQNLSDFSLI